MRDRDGVGGGCYGAWWTFLTHGLYQLPLFNRLNKKKDKMDPISQTTFSNAFAWMKMFEYQSKFHWSLFLRVHLTISQHWFRWWLGADQATSHYLDQWWLNCRRIYASFDLNELTYMQNIFIDWYDFIFVFDITTQRLHSQDQQTQLWSPTYRRNVTEQQTQKQAYYGYNNWH